MPDATGWFNTPEETIADLTQGQARLKEYIKGALEFLKDGDIDSAIYDLEIAMWKV